jgi:hypothetical protein
MSPLECSRSLVQQRTTDYGSLTKQRYRWIARHRRVLPRAHAGALLLIRAAHRRGLFFMSRVAECGPATNKHGLALNTTKSIIPPHAANVDCPKSRSHANLRRSLPAHNHRFVPHNPGAPVSNLRWGTNSTGHQPLQPSDTLRTTNVAGRRRRARDQATQCAPRAQ